MRFVADDPLCELAWSRRKGLILRYAVRSIPEKKSSFSSGAGPGNMIHSSLHAIGTENDDDKLAEERTFVPTQTASEDLPGEAAAPSIPLKISDGQTPSGVERDSGLEDGRMQDFSPESSDHLLSSRPHPGDFPDRNACGPLVRGENNEQARPQSPLEGSSPHEKSNLRKPLDALMLQESSSQCKGLNRSNTLQKEDGENKKPTPSSSSVLPVDKRECIAENDSHGKEQVCLEVYEISKASPIRAFASGRKGKEKAMSDGDHKMGVSQEEDDSYRSSESFNSTGICVGKKRVTSFEEQLIVGSKRLKMQIQETQGSTSAMKSNSSFANWISAMIIGSPRSDPSKLVISAREQDSKLANMGFQTLFESIYRPNLKTQDERFLRSENHWTSECRKELKLTNNSSEANNNTVISNRPKGASQDPFVKPTDMIGNGVCVPFGFKTDASSRSFSLTPKSGDKLFHASVDIDCFKVSKDVESQAHSSEEPSSSSCKKLQNFPLDVGAGCTLRKIEAQGSKSSEPMVSLLSKRLDALKQIMPMDCVETTASSTTCFLCGITGHDLRRCPQLTETEVGQLLRSISAYGGRKELPCLCIRCFQLNRGTDSCPNVPSRKKCQSKDRVAHHNDFNSSAVWNEERFERNFHKVNLVVKESSTLIGKGSANLQKDDAPSCKEISSTLPDSSYPCGSLTRQGLDVQKGIFEAVKSLRLSRTDIIKWTNSVFSAALDGYYLRLRVGKSGQGLGGSSYQVACICRSQGGNLAETSKRPISVILSGIKCSVECQYISNQDFLEDELKAWWSATLRDDGKIPSEDELRSKVKERRRLGL